MFGEYSPLSGHIPLPIINIPNHGYPVQKVASHTSFNIFSNVQSSFNKADNPAIGAEHQTMDVIKLLIWKRRRFLKLHKVCLPRQINGM